MADPVVETTPIPAASATAVATETKPIESTTPVVETPKDSAGKPVEDPKPKEPEGGKKVEAPAITLKNPEGSVLGAARVEEIAAFSKARGFSQEQAQALLERENEGAKTVAQANVQALDKANESWLNEIKTDREFGGDNLKATTEFAKRAVDRFGSDALKKALNDSRLGNHPELVRAWARIGRAMAPDKIVVGGPGSEAVGKKDMATTFYGEEKKTA